MRLERPPRYVLFLALFSVMSAFAMTFLWKPVGPPAVPITLGVLWSSVMGAFFAYRYFREVDAPRSSESST